MSNLIRLALETGKGQQGRRETTAPDQKTRHGGRAWDGPKTASMVAARAAGEWNNVERPTTVPGSTVEPMRRASRGSRTGSDDELRVPGAANRKSQTTCNQETQSHRQHAPVRAHIVKHVVAQTRTKVGGRTDARTTDIFYSMKTRHEESASHSTARIWRTTWLGELWSALFPFRRNGFAQGDRSVCPTPEYHLATPASKLRRQ